MRKAVLKNEAGRSGSDPNDKARLSTWFRYHNTAAMSRLPFNARQARMSRLNGLNSPDRKSWLDAAMSPDIAVKRVTSEISENERASREARNLRINALLRRVTMEGDSDRNALS